MTEQINLTEQVHGLLPAANGGTGVGSLSATPAASSIALWDANENLSANNVLESQASTATAAGTTVLTIASAPIQIFTGSTTQTVTLPTTSVPAGYQTMVINQSTGAVTVQSSGANTVVVLAPGAAAIFTAAVATPTTAANWGTQYGGVSMASGKLLTVSNSLTLQGTDGTSFTFPGTSDTVVTLGNAQALTSKTATLAAGTSSVAPLTLTSGTNLTSPAPGAVEFDGTCFYNTAAATTRQVADAEQFCTLTSTYTLASQTAAQKLFNASTNGAVTLPIGAYFFECFFSLSSLNTGTSSIFGFALTAGTATIAGQVWQSVADAATLATAAAPVCTVNTGANTAIVGTSTAGVGWAKITGKVRISVAGTVTPQVSLNQAAAAIVGVDSYFRIWPVGINTVTKVGNWS